MADSCVIVLQNTKLAVDRALCTDVAKVVAIRHPDEEVEVRFGHTIDGKNYSGLSGSDTESSREMWYRLVRLLSSSVLYTQSAVEKTLSESFGSIRKITNLDTPVAPIYQEKKRIQTLDILTFRVGGYTHTVRLNRASEKGKPAVTKGKPDFSRIRTRLAFTSKDGSHRIDLTYVSSLDGEARGTYEVEIEYLRALKDTSDRPDLKAFFDPIKLVTYVIKGDKELVTTIEYSQAIQAYNSFFAKEARFDPSKLYKRALPQPINLKKPMISRMTAYAVTNKLNGSRMVGIISGADLFGINMVSDVVKIAGGLPAGLDKTVFDAEYFKGVLYVFDILFDKGADVRGMNLDVRLARAAKIVEAVASPGLMLKVFRMSGDLEVDVRQVLEYNSTLPEDDNDGLIFTPITVPYFNDGIYKWKPPHMLTIDFTASKIGAGQWTLQVKDKNDRLVTFAPAGFNGTIQSTKELTGVGEYKWTGETFELVRSRPDKDIPNFITIAQDVWDDIRHPITEDELPGLFSAALEEDRDAIRKYHNSIKRDLIMKLAAADFGSGKVVVDLGAGKGGDLGKYQAAKIKSLIAVEPNPVFAAELGVRAEAMRAKRQLGYSLEVVPARAQDNGVIGQALKGKKADAAAMFFSLSFFFENNLSLIELVRTLNETVEKDGYFIGTTIDGEAVRAALDGKEEITFGPVTIRKKYKDFSGPIEFGKAIDYIYTDSATVVDTQREYLVDWALFVKRLAEQGFLVEESDLFKPTGWLSEDENRVTTLYRSFVFKRSGGYGGKEKPMAPPSGKPPAHLKMLPNGTSAVLKSTLVPELAEKGLEYKLVRTGTIGDGNCFFYSVMQAIVPGYKNLSKPEQEKLVTEYRKSLNVTKEEWLGIWHGNFARIGQAEFPGFDTRFWNYLQDEVSGYMARRNHIEAAVGQYGIKNFLQALGARQYANMDLPRFIAEIRKVFPTFIRNEEHRAEAIAQLDALIERSMNEAYTSFIGLVKACGSWVGQEVLDLVSQNKERDIYILNDADGAPYPTECLHVKGRKSIILLFQGGSHYECVGRQLANGSIQREFESDDPLITLIQEKIC
jgi:hypothetical protein